MPAPAWEDLEPFFDLDEFATLVEVETRAGNTRQFQAMFDWPYEDAEMGEYSLDTRAPHLTCRATDADGLGRGDYATVGGVRYDILTGPQYDGTGLAMIELSAAT
ncbi:MAG: hypothetical protein PF501_19065 [Salinisphaera sp.]|jgi:hypothetical protein|nr:hypothetical protein [Salinisphaera sp.]